MSDQLLARLLDPDWLSGQVGRPVRATRVRPKPGVSHLAALVCADGEAPGQPLGWVRLLVGDARVKADKMRARAQRAGLGDRLGCRRLADGLLLWGPMAADSALVGELARLGLVDPASQDGLASGLQVLRYNPGRRLVLRRADHVLRLTADPHRDRLARLADQLSGQVPVLAPVPAGEAGLADRARLSVWPYLSGHDLASTATAEQLHEAGAALAALHAVPPPDMPTDELPGRGWREVYRSARRSVAQLAEVAPAFGEAAEAALALLPRAVAASAPVPSHGDFSLDQCLADGRGGPVLLTDLDRACLAPVQLDLAMVTAVGLLSGQPTAPLTEGYADAVGEPLPSLGPWMAAALLGRVAEPWRGQDDDWPVRTHELLDLVGEVLAQPAAGSAWLVPTVVHDRDGSRLQVARAWPDKRLDPATVSVEGRDQQGRLRAGTLDRRGAGRLLGPGHDARLPGLDEVSGQGRLVVHRAGRRAVVALPDRYLKVLRPSRCAAAVAAARAGWALAEVAGMVAPQVLAGDGPAGVLAMSVVPGVAVHELAGGPQWQQLWQAWAQSWTRLQALDGEALAGLGVHLDGDEAQVLRTWRDRAVAAGVLAGTAWPDRLAEVADELAGQQPPSRLVASHRDLHDKQLLWDGDRLGVLDFDTACLAAPELDLANLAVHADLRVAQGLWSEPAAQTVRSAVAEVAAAAGVVDTRFRAAERATVARLAGVYAFRPGHRTAVLGWAEDRWRR